MQENIFFKIIKKIKKLTFSVENRKRRGDSPESLNSEVHLHTCDAVCEF